MAWEAWLDGDACDGFNVMFPYLPEGLDDFVDKVVPELQRRGMFRTEYEGAALRDHLGLLAVGPLSRGSFWEITSVPDIRVQAAKVARHLASMN